MYIHLGTKLYYAHKESVHRLCPDVHISYIRSAGQEELHTRLWILSPERVDQATDKLTCDELVVNPRERQNPKRAGGPVHVDSSNIYPFSITIIYHL